MKLSTRSRYGTRILIELARKGAQSPVQVSEISRQQKIPVKYIEQLVRTLKSAKMVKSVRGAKGGHLLSKPADTITLAEVVRIFESQSDLVECISRPAKCDMASKCHVRLAWKQATDALYEKLDTITIADLICD
ncbi:MAG: Rrf2 family transcriptional regulator [Desulfobacteraceae bacterium]|nr:Rrf2 family transcriptional regulator [Desulfobacteraceae bacterium]